MRKYRIVLDHHPKGFHDLVVEADGELDLAGFERVELGGVTLVLIREWLVNPEHIVAIVPEDADERQTAGVSPIRNPVV